MSVWLGRAALGVVAAALIAAGCGGGDESEPASGSAVNSTQLNSKEFVKRANAICMRERADSFNQVAAYTREHRSEGLSEDALLKAATKAVLTQTVEDELAALRALEPSAPELSEFEAILAELRLAVEKVKREEGKSRTARDVTRDLGAADERLEALGLRRCRKGL